MRASMLLFPSNFNPRSHEGSDHFFADIFPGADNFNPRSHEGSDAVSIKHIIHSFRFQSSLPRGERLRCASAAAAPPQFQSTLPRGERQYRYILSLFLRLYFNPRSHEGSDNFTGTQIYSRHLFQSTLPRGERPPGVCSAVSPQIFQSTLPRGERRCITMIMSEYTKFQSTLPRGERPWTTMVGATITLDFNPRSHEGSDCTRTGQQHSSFYFNPRSHEGSDIDGVDRVKQVKKFQSTLPRGERRNNRNNIITTIKYFNPRSHEGSDCADTLLQPLSVYFNPRSHEGSD